MPRYSAKLLFQWNPEPNGVRGAARRLCEERIVTYRASSSRAAVAKARSFGRKGEVRSGGVRLQFVGIVQLMELGLESEPQEVWWELSRRVRPTERRAQLIPAERDLLVYRDEGRVSKRGRRPRKGAT
jgi:hypothetical protein